MAEEIKNDMKSAGKEYSQYTKLRKDIRTRLDEAGKAEDKEQFLGGFWARIHRTEVSKIFLEAYRNVSFEELRPDDDIIVPPLFEGTPEDAVLQARVAVDARKNKRRQIIRLYEKTICNTLAEWELRGEATSENRIDLVVMPLARNEVTLSASLDTIKFMAGLERYIADASPKTLTAGYCITWGSLADWMIKSGYRICRAWGATVHSRLICTILHEEGSAPDILNLLATDANTLASTLDDLGERSDQQLTIMNRCHLLTPLYRTVPDEAINRKPHVERVMKPLGLAGGDGQLTHAWMLTQMQRVSRAWELLEPMVFSHDLLDAPVDTGAWKNHRDKLPLLLYCVAGLLRVCLVEDKDFDEPVSSFFNATVAANRIGEKTTEQRQQLVPLRALLGGIGLWWALRVTTDAGQALVAFNGFECLVNMFGALSDMPKLIHDKQAARRLADGALQYGDQSNQMRMQVSLNQLEIVPENTGVATIQQLRTDTETMLIGIMRQGGMGELDVTKQLRVDDLREPVIYWAEVLIPHLRTVINDVGKSNGTYDECIGLINQLLQNLAVLKGKGRAFIAERIWRREEMEGLALLDTAQVKIPDAWRDAIEAYKDGPPESLAEFVRDYAGKVFETSR